MKIAFFGLRRFFDYFRIGGFESFVRRLALGMASSGNDIDYILYDAPAGRIVAVSPNLKMIYCRTFGEGVSRLLAGDYDHIFTVRLARGDRLKYPFLIRKSGRRTRWHHLCLAWPEAIYKRPLTILEGRLNSFRGYNICVSPRQYRAVRRFNKASCLVIPPVPEEYFLTLAAKRQNRKINVTFLGNLTRDKGVDEIIGLFKTLGQNPRFHCSIYGTYDRHNPDSVELHRGLQSQPDIAYTNVDLENYSPAIDVMVKNVLQDTDVFLQPYRRLENTLDLPLLLLEAMASLCAVITTPAGDVADIYGESKFVIPLPQFRRQAENLLTHLSREEIMAERERLYRRNRELNFNQTSVAGRLAAILEG